jgi:hypothetical protein
MESSSIGDSRRRDAPHKSRIFVRNRASLTSDSLRLVSDQIHFIVEGKMTLRKTSFAACFAAIALAAAGGNALAQDCNETDEDKNIWRDIKDSDNPNLFLKYLKEFKDGCHRKGAVFKIDALVPEDVSMRVSAMYAGGEWREQQDGHWVDYDGGRVIERIKVQRVAVDPHKLTIELQCDAEGKGNSGWIAGDANCHPSGSAPIQGYAARLRGNLSEFYDLTIQCGIVNKATDDKSTSQPVHDGNWCGATGGQPQLFLFKILLSAPRRQFTP